MKFKNRSLLFLLTVVLQSFQVFSEGIPLAQFKDNIEANKKECAALNFLLQVNTTPYFQSLSKSLYNLERWNFGDNIKTIKDFLEEILEEIVKKIDLGKNDDAFEIYKLVFDDLLPTFLRKIGLNVKNSDSSIIGDMGRVLNPLLPASRFLIRFKDAYKARLEFPKEDEFHNQINARALIKAPQMLQVLKNPLKGNLVGMQKDIDEMKKKEKVSNEWGQLIPCNDFYKFTKDQ